jgi:hypothetical protein
MIALSREKKFINLFCPDRVEKFVEFIFFKYTCIKQIKKELGLPPTGIK